MQLIVKPTGRCNFNCTFCSAGLLKIKHSEKVPEELKKVLNTIQPENIIFTGGDPLCVNPTYYEEILNLGNWTISLTTNLKDFYLNPNKWLHILTNPRVDVCTSFQFGEERKWDKNTVYTLSMFKKVVSLFKEKIGYIPPFIALVNNENENQAINHILLAKELGTKCKLNPTLPLGKAKDFYPLYKMIDIWLKIKELNLENYQDVEIPFYKGGCGTNTSLLCDTTIRSFWIDSEEKVVYSKCEDCAVNKYYIPIDKEKVIPKQTPLNMLTNVNKNCAYCELCNLCNGCNSIKKMNKMTKNHCQEMLKRKDKILAAKWKL